jgi:hypothetical protein
VPGTATGGASHRWRSSGASNRAPGPPPWGGQGGGRGGLRGAARGARGAARAAEGAARGARGGVRGVRGGCGGAVRGARTPPPPPPMHTPHSHHHQGAQSRAEISASPLLALRAATSSGGVHSCTQQLVVPCATGRRGRGASVGAPGVWPVSPKCTCTPRQNIWCHCPPPPPPPPHPTPHPTCATTSPRTCGARNTIQLVAEALNVVQPVGNDGSARVQRAVHGTLQRRARDFLGSRLRWEVGWAGAAGGLRGATSGSVRGCSDHTVAVTRSHAKRRRNEGEAAGRRNALA